MRIDDKKICPLVSVIVPVYNANRYIESTVKSISNQTYNNLEIIIVDDGSTDDTFGKLNELAKQDSRIKVLHKQNGGCPSARNMGIENANGAYLQFVDADDTLQPDMINKMFKYYCLAPVDLVICGHNRNKYATLGCCVAKESGKLWKTGEINKEEFIHLFADMAYGRVIGWEYTWDKLYRKDIVDAYHIRYDESLKKYGDDSQFSLEYINVCENLRLIDDCLYNFRINIYKSGIETQTSGFRKNVFNLQLITLDLLKCFLQQNGKFNGEIEKGWSHMYVNEAIKAIYLNYRDDSPYPIEKRIEIICDIKNGEELRKALKFYEVKTAGEDKKMPYLLRKGDDIELIQYLDWKVKKIYK